MIKQNQKFLNGTFVVLDILVLLISFAVAWFLKFESGLFPFDAHLALSEYIRVLIFVIPIFILLQYIFNLYAPHRNQPIYREIISIIKTNIILFITMMSVLFVIKQIHISREFIVIFITTNIIMLSGERGVVRIFLRTIRRKGLNIKHVMVIGAGDLAVKYLKAIERQKQLGYTAMGILDDEKKRKTKIVNTPVIGNVDELGSILEKHFVDEVVVALPLHQYDRLKDILGVCEKFGVKTLIIPDYLKYVSARPQFDEIEDIILINTRYVPLDNVGNRVMKRLFDIITAFAALVVFSPIMVIICVLIKISSHGPVIFKQERVGYNRKPFIMYKFRTMKYQPDTQSDTEWTTSNDPRKTKLGNLLRKTSLDELPQLFNVLKGDMSIIGPRPERPHFVEQFKEEIPKYMVKHYVRPGLTGWAQVNGWRGDTSIPERIKHDIYYIENWSFMFDVRILCLTLVKGFVNRNAY